MLERAGPDLTKRLIGTVFGVFLRGGRRVDLDADGSQRARALLDHARNGDVHELCLLGEYRDDSAPGSEDVAFATVSPRGNLQAIRASGAAVFSYGGWLDGGYAQAAARRFSSLGRSELLLGPWGHAGFFAHDPAGRTHPAAFPHELELLRFFDRELKSEGSCGRLAGALLHAGRQHLEEGGEVAAAECPRRAPHAHAGARADARGGERRVAARPARSTIRQLE